MTRLINFVINPGTYDIIYYHPNKVLYLTTILVINYFIKYNSKNMNVID